MNTLPVPIIVAQNGALNPDGTVDPAHATDCGEANLSSVVHTHTGLLFAPGCIRETLGRPEFDGRTTGQELRDFLAAMGMKASLYELVSSDAWDQLALSRHHGQYHIVLGNWIAPNALHWETVYQRGTSRVFSMDPWTGSYATTGEAAFDRLYAGEMVTVRP